MTPSLVNTALSEWIEPVAKWSFSLLWRWRAGRYESPSRSNGSGRAGIGWEFGWSPQRDGARHKKTEDVPINNSWASERVNVGREIWRRQIYENCICCIQRFADLCGADDKEGSPCKLSRPGLIAREKKPKKKNPTGNSFSFFPTEAQRRGDHATAHRARSNSARCPEAEKSEQTLRKPHLNTTTTALCCLMWATARGYSVVLSPFLSGKVKTKRVSNYSLPRQSKWTVRLAHARSIVILFFNDMKKVAQSTPKLI